MIAAIAFEPPPVRTVSASIPSSLKKPFAFAMYPGRYRKPWLDWTIVILPTFFAGFALAAGLPEAAGLAAGAPAPPAPLPELGAAGVPAGAGAFDVDGALVAPP